MANVRNKKRSNGFLQSKVFLGEKDGKKQYKYVYARTQKELDKKVVNVRTKIGKGIDLTAERDTFSAWGEIWLKLKKAEVSDKRYNTYRQRYENLSDIYNLPITKIRAADIQEIIYDYASLPSEKTGKPYAKNTLKEIKMVASQIIQLAINNRVLDYNCALAVKIPNAEISTRRALTDEEQQWIRETPHRMQIAAMIMMYAGLRRGELLALTWSDIDLEERTITVNKSVCTVDSKPQLKSGGKTKAAERVIFIPNILVEFLTNYDRPKFSLVFPNINGGLVSESVWERIWNSYLLELNLKYGDWEHCVLTKGKRPEKCAPIEKPMLIEPFTAHCLRHTYFTICHKAGVDVMTAMEQGGHADIKTTMNIYTHLDKEYKKQDISKLNTYLEKRNEKKEETS